MNSLDRLTPEPRAWILDLDGVLWLGSEPISGSPEAIERLRAAGDHVLFLTNNSHPTVEELVSKLKSFGVAAEPEDVITSAQAAAALIQPGGSVLVCGGPGIEEALRDRNIRIVAEGPADAVIVGFHREFDYDRMTVAFRAVDGGATLIGTNDDATYPTPDGPIPGGGSILAAVATAAGVAPQIAGKPYEPMAALVRSRLGPGPAPRVLVGDRLSTDGLMAERLSVPFALVTSGVTTVEVARDATAEFISPDLASLVGPAGELNATAHNFWR